MTLKVSDRDKKLLLILLIVVIIGGAVKLFDAIATANTEKETELRSLNNRYDELTLLSTKKAAYQREIEANEAEYTRILSEYGNNLSEEKTLVFLGLIEKNTGVWLKQMGFSTINPVYSFGQVTSSNPDNAGQKVYSSDYTGISTQLSLSYECTYDQLTDVLEYIREQGRKATINNISFAYSESADIVSGTMQMTLYAITGSDRVIDSVKIKDVPVGTENIFQSDTFSPTKADSSYRDRIINDYDLYLIANPVNSDMDTVTMGIAGDPANETVVSSDKDGNEDVIIDISGASGSYTIGYRVGNETYPKEYQTGAPLICGDTLDMLFISKPRTDSLDTSVVNVQISNNSDMTLNVAVHNDDPENPRVIISSVGSVVMHNE